MSENIKTHFKGPGEWRRQAAQLEADREKGDAPIKGRAGQSS